MWSLAPLAGAAAADRLCPRKPPFRLGGTHPGYFRTDGIGSHFEVSSRPAAEKERPAAASGWRKAGFVVHEMGLSQVPRPEHRWGGSLPANLRLIFGGGLLPPPISILL